MGRTFTITSQRREWVFPMEEDARHLFLSDTHYGHGKIILYAARPFLDEREQALRDRHEAFEVSAESVRRMNRTLIERINEAARPQDILWHLGDVACRGMGPAAEFLGSLRCKNVVLVWGNHDEPDLADLVPRRLARPNLGGRLGPEEDVVPCYDQALVLLEGQKIQLSHYPHDTWEGAGKGAWHLYGHVHGALDDRHRKNPAWALSLDAGVDSHDFRPWSLGELRTVFDGRRKQWQAWRDRLKGKDED
jgi:calcineurin-like phosphoesterase family protein